MFRTHATHFTCVCVIFFSQDDVNFQFPSGMKIIGDQLWAVSNQLQNLFISDPLNPNTIKYRVLVGKIDDLLDGTGCSKRLASPYNPSPSPSIAAYMLTNLNKDRVIFNGKSV